MNSKQDKFKYHNQTAENERQEENVESAQKKNNALFKRGTMIQNDHEFLIRKHGGQNEVEQIVARLYKVLLQFSNKKTIQPKKKKSKI